MTAPTGSKATLVRRRTRRFLFRLVTGAFSGTFLFGIASCDLATNEWEEHEIILGYEGEARTNPFLAAERFSQRMGHSSESRLSLAPFPRPGEIMVVPAEAVVGMGMAGELESWIRRGGHLIYLVSGGDSSQNEFTEQQFGGVFKPPLEADHALLETFEIDVIAGGDEVDEIEFDGKNYLCEIPEGPRLNVSKLTAARTYRGSLVESDGSTRSAAFGTFPVGIGRLTVLADASIWRNSKIGEFDHAALLADVLDLPIRNSYGRGSVTYIIGVGTSFWALLRHHGWMALVALALVLIVWLWKNLTRFGPSLHVGGDHSREFTEHVAVAGRFLWSKRRPDVLLDAARRRIRTALRRRHATLELDSPEAPEFLAAACSLPEPRIREAITAHATRDPNTLTRLMRDLQSIEASL